MAQHNFQGDISCMNERQMEFINSVIKEQGFPNNKITFEPVGKAGDNYVAAVKRIVMEGENGTMKIIAKIAPSDQILRVMLNSDMVFHNEHIMYTQVLPKFIQLQRDANIPKEEQLRFAKCYGSFQEQPNEVILLEDLKTADFEMLDRFESLSNECVKSVLKNFGVLHSLSYVLKNKEPETFDSFKTSFKDVWTASNDNPTSVAAVEQLKMYFQILEANALSVLEKPEHKAMVKDQITAAIPLSAELFKSEGTNKYSIIQHGDAWTNNVMFRFEDGKVKESVLIDYQLSKNCSPAYDFLHMTLNCTNQETRSKHFLEWIDYYHSELDRSLAKFGLNAMDVYPKDEFVADLKRYGKLLFSFSVVLASMLTTKSEDASRLQDSIKDGDASNMAANMSISSFDQETVLRFRTKLVELIHSCKEFGLI